VSLGTRPASDLVTASPTPLPARTVRRRRRRRRTPPTAERGHPEHEPAAAAALVGARSSTRRGRLLCRAGGRAAAGERLRVCARTYRTRSRHAHTDTHTFGSAAGSIVQVLHARTHTLMRVKYTHAHSTSALGARAELTSPERV